MVALPRQRKREHLETNKTNKTDPIEFEEILELFEKLEPLLKNRNTECLKYIDYIISIPGTEDLVYQIEEYDFKLALKTLDNLKKKFESTNK